MGKHESPNSNPQFTTSQLSAEIDEDTGDVYLIVGDVKRGGYEIVIARDDFAKLAARFSTIYIATS